MTDINIHIGCHGIFDGAIDSFVRNHQEVSGLDGISLISAGAYRKNWKSAVTMGGDDLLRAARNSALTKSLAIDGNQLHVLSNPRILGSDVNLLKGTTIYPDAEQRVDALVRILDSFDVSLRVIICEYNLFCRLTSSRSAAVTGNSYPWADFIRRVAVGGSGVDIRVFALMDPRRATSALPEILFDPGIYIDPELVELQMSALKHFTCFAGGAPTGDEIRAYEEDLAAISNMTSVILRVL